MTLSLFGQADLMSGFRSNVPVGYPGDPAAVAGAAAYFLDPENPFTTEAELSVDGGILAYLP